MWGPAVPSFNSNSRALLGGAKLHQFVLLAEVCHGVWIEPKIHPDVIAGGRGEERPAAGCGVVPVGIAVRVEEVHRQRTVHGGDAGGVDGRDPLRSDSSGRSLPGPESTVAAAPVPPSTAPNHFHPSSKRPAQ